MTSEKAAPQPPQPDHPLAPPRPPRLALTPERIPFLPRGVRLHDDPLRKIRVLLAPERAIELDQIGDAILSELDGTRSLSQIVDNLAARYGAPREQIAGDVAEFLSGLVARLIVDVKEAP